MIQSDETNNTIALMIQRLLSGPARPGQAFTMPGCNYDCLYRMARRIKAIFNCNKKDNAPVCLCSDDRAVMASAILASLADGPELLMPHALSATALLELHRLTGFTRAIGKPGDILPPGVSVIDVDARVEAVETLASRDEPALDRPWIHLFTGGSTGTPRLWSKTPRNLLGEVDYLIKCFEIGSNDRILATVPALHIYGLLYSLLVPMAASARVVAETPSFPEEIKQHMADMSPTIFVSVPVHYRALKETPLEKGALRLAYSSAGPLAETDGVAFSKVTDVDLVEIYGSTETGGIATRCRKKGEVGFKPYDCIQWRVAGDSLDIRSSFLSAELPVRSSGWFTVADRVEADGSNGFVVTGRADNIIKVGGNRVDLEKIHQTILGIEGIEDALVLANPADTGRNREIVALVVGSRSPAEVKAVLNEVLEPHERPRRIRMVDHIPMAATGKIDRRAIEKITSIETIVTNQTQLSTCPIFKGVVMPSSSSSTTPPVVISGSGLWTPEHIITNQELVASYNEWANRYNERHAAAIGAGELEPKPMGSVEFIEKASGIKQRYAYIKEGILDVERMRPTFPERPEEVLSDQAEMAVHAARQAMEAAGKTADDIDAVIVSCAYTQRAYPAIAIEVQEALGIVGFGFDMLVACSAATFALHRAYEMVAAGTANCVLTINPELTSPQINYCDRDSHFIFGDVATATVVERADTCTAQHSYQILGTRAQTKFSSNVRSNFSYVSRANDVDPFGIDKLFHQNGRRVFKEVCPLVIQHLAGHVSHQGFKIPDVKRWWLHQANINMNLLISGKLLGRKATFDEAPIVLDQYANTASAGSLIAFHLYHQDLESGDVGVICSFGAGYSIGSLVVLKQ